jgi:UDP-N-acetylmuramoylalanine--D-glutamate ligase
MARSGLSAARLLVSLGGIVTGIDDTSELAGIRVRIIDELVANGMTLFLEPSIDAKRDLLRNSDVLVLSPGVPLADELREVCLESGCEIIGELELAYRLCPCPIIAVTGSNGKTTTVCLIYEFLKAAGFRAHLVGNVGSSYDPETASGYFLDNEKILFTSGVGVPFCERIDDINAGDIVVTEASSYQLESTSRFHPRVAVLLNIVEDHLARHSDMDGYIAAKGRMFMNQERDDYAVLNADDPMVDAAYRSGGGSARLLRFSTRDETCDAFYRDGIIFMKVDSQAALFLKREEFAPPGVHNVENLMAAVLAAGAAGAGIDKARSAARQFRGVEHRIEYIGEFNGVAVYNDSKGTNPDSTIKALASFESPVILILGGYEKGSDFTPLYEILPENARFVLIVGATAERLDRELAARGFENRAVVRDIAGALGWVCDNSAPGDILLFSPASASFDMFTSYEERGRTFKKLVVEILAGNR